MKLIGGNINNLQQINVHFSREKKIRNKNTINHKYFENLSKYTKDIRKTGKKWLNLFQGSRTVLDIIHIYLRRSSFKGSSVNLISPIPLQTDRQIELKSSFATIKALFAKQLVL